MDFFIKKNATLPLLVTRVIKDGRSDFHKYFESLTSTTVNFSMKNVDTQKFKVINGDCIIKKYTNGETDEYVVYYQFKNRDTDLIGRYEGEFNIQYSEGKIGLPLKDKIYVNVVDSFAANNLSYSSNTATIINNICCGGPISEETFFLLTENAIIIATEDDDNILWL
jgi:hypothetical protein